MDKNKWTLTHQSMREVTAMGWSNTSDYGVVFCCGNPGSLTKMFIGQSVSSLVLDTVN